ncbi:PREDICTED: uncharacterized protein LOC105359721 [Ceratosolen solmsi marchali]|uniref:Uncharacterized protein LOC105359721 n=1 Tax=Ceratosolen solmsi marchali TaxID=326594 RepID=A0AAJ6YC80_9HYME|nr:PREDICTED: uncharacterized protein LOC105359721 [Ceratosolen solmsi marchali]
MNDSFLEDLDLVPKDPNLQSNTQLNNRYITTRKVLSSPSNVDQNAEPKHDKIISSSGVPKIKSKRLSRSQESCKLSGSELKPLSSTPKSDKNQGDENLMKPLEYQIRIDDMKMKQQNVKIISKSHESKSVTDHRRSGSSGSSSRYLDTSSKENTRPFTDSSSSKESGSQTEMKKDCNRGVSDILTKKSDILDKADPVIFLSAIKDLVSRYTEQETVKVLRAMQNLHINSQANLIKHLMHQTNELVKELNLYKNFDNVKVLIEENEKMREDIFLLRTRNEILQKKVDEMSLIKEENISLKLKIKELQE